MWPPMKIRIAATAFGPVRIEIGVNGGANEADTTITLRNDARSLLYRTGPPDGAGRGLRGRRIALPAPGPWIPWITTHRWTGYMTPAMLTTCMSRNPIVRAINAAYATSPAAVTTSPNTVPTVSPRYRSAPKPFVSIDAQVPMMPKARTPLRRTTSPARSPSIPFLLPAPG